MTGGKFTSYTPNLTIRQATFITRLTVLRKKKKALCKAQPILSGNERILLWLFLMKFFSQCVVFNQKSQEHLKTKLP